MCYDIMNDILNDIIVCTVTCVHLVNDMFGI